MQAFQGIPFKFRSSKSGLFINSQDSHCIPVCFSVPVCRYIILNTANRKSRNFGDCLRSEQEFRAEFRRRKFRRNSALPDLLHFSRILGGAGLQDSRILGGAGVLPASLRNSVEFPEFPQVLHWVLIVQEFRKFLTSFRNFFSFYLAF